jgi:hypothetical protein
MYGTGGHANHEQKVEVNIQQTTATTDAKFENPFVAAIVADGLVDAKKFSIELKDDQLSINGTVQPKEVLEKYQSLLNGKTELKIDVN